MFLFRDESKGEDGALLCYLLPLGPTEEDSAYQRMNNWPTIPFSCNVSLSARWDAFKALLANSTTKLVSFNATGERFNPVHPFIGHFRCLLTVFLLPSVSLLPFYHHPPPSQEKPPSKFFFTVKLIIGPGKVYNILGREYLSPTKRNYLLS